VVGRGILEATSGLTWTLNTWSDLSHKIEKVEVYTRYINKKIIKKKQILDKSFHVLIG